MFIFIINQINLHILILNIQKVDKNLMVIEVKYYGDIKAFIIWYFGIIKSKMEPIKIC